MGPVHLVAKFPSRACGGGLGTNYAFNLRQRKTFLLASSGTSRVLTEGFLFGESSFFLYETFQLGEAWHGNSPVIASRIWKTVISGSVDFHVIQYLPLLRPYIPQVI